MRWYDGLAAVVLAGLATYFVTLPLSRDLEGPAYDLLLRARHEIYGQNFMPRGGRPPASPVVVVALDEDTGLRPPFDRLPQELWTPQIAEVMRAALEAGALFIAQQQAFVASADSAVSGYDATYLEVLREAAGRNRIVLGRRAPAPDRLGPALQHAEAAGGDRNVRHIALYPDRDGVLRHAALYEALLDRTGVNSLYPSLALELAARVIGERPHLRDGSDLLLGRYVVPGSQDNTMLLNFHGGDGGIPVFSLGDLHACAEDGDAAFFRKHFDNKVVIFGRTDAPRWRRVTAARFLGVRAADRYAERCRLPLMQSLAGRMPGEGTLPEVLVSATAVRNLLMQEAVKSLPQIAVIGICALLALAIAWAVLRLPPHLVGLSLAVVFAGWGYLAVVMLAHEYWLMPLAQPALAVIVSFAAAWIYRSVRRI